MSRLVRFSMVVIAVIGCAGAPTTNPTPGASVPLVRLRAEPYSFAYNSGMDQPARLIVRDDATWQQLWSRIYGRQSPVPAPPAVDFSKEMIVIAALGTRATGGYSILLDKALEEGEGAIAVTVRSVSPGPRCGVTAALTQPVDVARLPRRDDAVRFVEHSEVTDCR